MSGQSSEVVAYLRREYFVRPIDVQQCPQCQSQLRVPSSLAGQQVRCPRCSALFVTEDDSVLSVLPADEAPLDVEVQKARWLPPVLPGKALAITVAIFLAACTLLSLLSMP